jgi:hypothetical protein
MRTGKKLSKEEKRRQRSAPPRERDLTNSELGLIVGGKKATRKATKKATRRLDEE